VPCPVCDQHLVKARDFSDHHGCPLVIHLAESRHELEESRRLKGAAPVEHLASLGVLSEAMVAAHVVWAELEPRARPAAGARRGNCGEHAVPP